MGRVNKGQWDTIKAHWLSLCLNREKEVGLSVLRAVAAQDEWCAEAYMETDYSNLTVEDFDNTARDYAIHKLTLPNVLIEAPLSPALTPAKWREFRYDEIFEIRKGYYNKKLPECVPSPEAIPFIGASESNNGVTSYHRAEDIAAYARNGELEPEPTTDKKLFPANGITVANNGASVGYAFFQPQPFTSSHDINPLYLLSGEMTPEIGVFLCSVIARDRYRWSYGRKWRPSRMPKSIIKLPVRADGKPDWEFMETYVRSLPFSKTILAQQ